MPQRLSDDIKNQCLSDDSEKKQCLSDDKKQCLNDKKQWVI